MNGAQTTSDGQLVIVGNPDPVHIGAHLLHAATALKIKTTLCNTVEAYAGPAWVAKSNWWLRGHRPTRLRAFSEQVYSLCRELGPRWLLATGLAPLDAPALRAIGALGVRRVNFLTDDPWNPAHRAPWFMEALPFYDNVFSPRHANLADLRAHGCKSVSYLPFGYSPEVHYPEPPGGWADADRYASDLVFVGGADRDRVPLVAPLIRAGVDVALYGGFWDRFAETRPAYRGYADPATLRKAVGGSRVALCLVRRANRDGHVMRSFEVPAIGACMLVEDTTEHRDLFGQDGESVVYFQTGEQMVALTRSLVADGALRQRLAVAAHDRIVAGEHTYADRLARLLQPPSGEVPASSG